MFHTSDGLYFDRDAKGNVSITKTDGKPPAEGGEVQFSHTIDSAI